MPSPRIESLWVRNFKSVGYPGVSISFPTTGPLVLLGENNAGKSNISRAMELLLGERWPKSYVPDDHDFFGRSPDDVDIKIGARVSGLECLRCHGSDVTYLRWMYDKQQDGDPCTFSFSCTGRCDGNAYVPNALREQLSCVFIGADRRLSYQLSYASKYTLLSKLMHRFHKKLTTDPARVERLRQIFRSTIDEFGTVGEFSEFRSLLRQTADDFGQNLAYQLDVDFAAYDPSNFFRSLRLQPLLDGDVRNFDELGTGQEQILALAFAYAYARAFSGEAGLVLAIDEPESNLHPIAQQWLAEKLHSMTSDGLQIVITTHSPHFVDLAQPETLVLARKDGPDGATSVTQYSRSELAAKLIEMGANPERTQPETIGPFYSTASTSDIKTGLFSRACILVEGDTERYAIPELLLTFCYDLLRAGVAMVPVGGVGNLAKWCRLFTALGVPVFPIFDTDSDKSGKQQSERERDRRDLLVALGEDPDLAIALNGAPIFIAEKFAAFDANFEAAMFRIAETKWAELTEASQEFVGSSKPLQARFASRQIVPGDLTSEGAALIAALAGRVAACFGHTVDADTVPLSAGEVNPVV